MRILDVYSLEDLKDISKDRISKDIAEVIAISSGSTNERHSRIALVGSSSMFVNKGLTKGANFDFINNIVSFLVLEDQMYHIPRKESKKFWVSNSSGNYYFYLYIISFFYPFLFLIFGFIVRRKRLKA